MPQYHNDLASTGQNLNETTLTTSTVNSGSFGKLFSTAADGQVYAQPLFLAGVSIAGATHNVLLVATEHDSVYALDADGANVVTATPNALNLWADATQTITVTNGLLTVTSGAGASNNKIDAIDVLPAPPATQALAIDAGGGAAGSFAADEDFSGGAARSTTATINTSGAANPAPAAVYQSQRFGNFTYTLPGLTAGAAYTVRLHFAEFVQNGPGLRTFGVAINGTTVLSNFDVFPAAGGFEAEPTTPATDLSGAGIDLHSGHVFNVRMSYDGTTLMVTIPDASTGASATQSYPVNIPAVIGSNTAFAGFTGGAGGQTATQDVLNRDYAALTL